MGDPSASLLQAQALLDGAAIPPADRAAFLASLAAALSGGDPALAISPPQRQPWARALLVVADLLLQPPPEPAPAAAPDAKDRTDEEEEEFLLTPSEFELWEKIKGVTADAAPVATPDPPTEDSAPLERLPDSEPEPQAKPAAADEFEDFVIDRVEFVS
jgi:hypothetical protein